MNNELRKVKKLLRDLCFAVSDLEGEVHEKNLAKNVFPMSATKDMVDSYYARNGAFKVEDIASELKVEKAMLRKALRKWGYYNKVIWSDTGSKRVWIKIKDRPDDPKHLYESFFGIEEDNGPSANSP